MWARVTTAQVDPADLAEDKRIFDEEVVPAAKEKKGFQGGLSLTDPSTGKIVVITLWASENEMLATEESGFWNIQVEKFSAILKGPAQREHYEVSSMDLLVHELKQGRF